MRAPRMRLVDVERGGVLSAYTAGIEVEGRRIGYVERLRGEDRYRAYAGGKRIGNGHTLPEIKQDIREALPEVLAELNDEEVD